MSLSVSVVIPVRCANSPRREGRRVRFAHVDVAVVGVANEPVTTPSALVSSSSSTMFSSNGESGEPRGTPSSTLITTPSGNTTLGLQQLGDQHEQAPIVDSQREPGDQPLVVDTIEELFRSRAADLDTPATLRQWARRDLQSFCDDQRLGRRQRRPASAPRELATRRAPPPG